MKLSELILKLIDAKADVYTAHVELEDAQAGCDGTWGYYLQENYEAVEKAEQSVIDAAKAVDDFVKEIEERNRKSKSSPWGWE